MNMRFAVISILTVFFPVFSAGMPSFAQDAPAAAEIPAASAAPATAEPVPTTPQPAEVPDIKAAEESVALESEKSTGGMRSLLFTVGEYSALQQAKTYRGMVRPPTEAELRDSLLPPSEKPMPPPEEREIKLGGIVYKSAKDWTIWLNGQRVTPDALPKQALDLKVREDYIEIKWFDEYTNQIFPLRLRAHQRFNIDARLFLPG